MRLKSDWIKKIYILEDPHVLEAMQSRETLRNEENWPLGMHEYSYMEQLDFRSSIVSVGLVLLIVFKASREDLADYQHNAVLLGGLGAQVISAEYTLACSTANHSTH